jgi:hypothetical protein
LSLQWGHGENAVEDWTADAVETFATGLQWGHGENAVEDNLVDCAAWGYHML